jgi:hypothetical protein
MTVVLTLIGIESRDKKPVGIAAVVSKENIVIDGDREPMAILSTVHFGAEEQCPRHQRKND